MFSCCSLYHLCLNGVVRESHGKHYILRYLRQSANDFGVNFRTGSVSS